MTEYHDFPDRAQCSCACRWAHDDVDLLFETMNLYPCGCEHCPPLGKERARENAIVRPFEVIQGEVRPL